MQRLTGILMCLAMCGVITLSHAQERSAGGSLEAQASWSALNSQIDGVRKTADTLQKRAAQAELCGAKGKIYGPAATSGKDADGCVNPYVDLSALTHLLDCSRQNAFFNGTSCVALPNPNKSAATYTKIVMAQGGGGGGTSTAVAECPAGYMRTGCSGARNESMTDTCEEDKCGLVGAGPIGERSCKATVDGDNGTRATVWATCVKINVE